MGSNQSWFVQQRAESLAVIFLTRNPKLRVQKMSEDHGIDYLVGIDRASSRYFGLEVKAATQMSSLVGKSGHLNRAVADRLQRLTQDAVFPIAVLAIDITTEAMRFGWIKPPVTGWTSESHPPRAIEMPPASAQQLDAAVQRVRDWYSRSTG